MLVDGGEVVRRVMPGTTTGERDEVVRVVLRGAIVLDDEELLLVGDRELLLRLTLGEEDRLIVRLELEEGRRIAADERVDREIVGREMLLDRDELDRLIVGRDTLLDRDENELDRRYDGVLLDDDELLRDVRRLEPASNSPLTLSNATSPQTPHTHQVLLGTDMLFALVGLVPKRLLDPESLRGRNFTLVKYYTILTILANKLNRLRTNRVPTPGSPTDTGLY